MSRMHIDFTPFFFADHSTPNGLLIHDRRAQACWYYVTCGHRNLADADDPVVVMSADTSAPPVDPIPMLANLVRSISTMYGISDPSEMLKFLDMCKEECIRCHYEWDDRVARVQPSDFVQKSSPGIFQ
jgi:hypothetical protein